jgi:hypothetical protein
LEEQAHRTEAVEKRAEGPASNSTQDDQYVIRLTRKGTEVHRVAGNKQAEVMGKLVEYLIKEEGLIDAIDIPYVPGTGRGSRALLNDEPKHTDQSEMRQYQLLTGGYYLFTSLSAADKKRYLPELPEKVGLNCQFEGEW